MNSTGSVQCVRFFVRVNSCLAIEAADTFEELVELLFWEDFLGNGKNLF
jgi:hypothetical protein